MQYNFQGFIIMYTLPKGGIPIDRGSDRPIFEKGHLDRGSDRPIFEKGPLDRFLKRVL